MNIFSSDYEKAGFPTDEVELLSLSDDDEAEEDLSTEHIPQTPIRLRGCGRGRGRGTGCRRARRPRCPTLRIPSSTMPNVSANMRNAIRLGKPRQLTRTTNHSQIRRNQRASGCRSLGSRPGHNCDEYPFASRF